MEKAKRISPFRLSSLLRLQKDPNLALQLFLNPNPNSKSNPKPFRYSPLSYDLIITKLGRAKMFDQMEQIIEMLKRETRFVPKEIIFCNIITFYGRGRLPDQALTIFDQIPSFKCKRTVKSVNTLLNALLNCREFEKMGEIFAVIGKYASPDVCTYNILINACFLRGDLDSAWKVFEKMRKRGPRPNEVTFGTLINALCENSELQEALELKTAMLGVFKVKPNASVYASLIKGFCKVDELSSAFKLKAEMLKRGVELDSAIYASLVIALFKVGGRRDAVKFLEEMRENTCKPHTVTYNAVICGFCQDRDFDAAFGVLNEMEEKRCKPDVITFNVIIGGLCKDGRLAEAMNLFNNMPKQKCAPDIVTYRTLFDGLCDGLQFKKATFILEEMVLKGFAPRTESIMKLVDMLSQFGDLKLLWTILHIMGKGNLVDAIMWQMVVPLVCRNNELSEGSKLLNTLVIP